MSFEQRLQHAARNALDTSADALAPDVLVRLAAIRQAALSESGATEVQSRWAPRLAMVATLLFAVGVWTQTRLPPAHTNSGREVQLQMAPVDVAREDAAPEDAALEDEAVVTAKIASEVVVDIALLEELEFVAWMALEVQDDAGDARYEG